MLASHPRQKPPQRKHGRVVYCPPPPFPRRPHTKDDSGARLARSNRSPIYRLRAVSYFSLWSYCTRNPSRLSQIARVAVIQNQAVCGEKLWNYQDSASYFLLLVRGRILLLLIFFHYQNINLRGQFIDNFWIFCCLRMVMLTRLLLPLDLNSFELCVTSISFHIKS